MRSPFGRLLERRPVMRDSASRPADPPGAQRMRWSAADAAAIGAYLAGGLVVTAGLWRALGRTDYVGPGYSDLIFFEWFMEHGARVLTHFENPFFTDRMNAPLGVNTLVNTSVLGLSLVLAPVTLALGAWTSVVLSLVLGLAGTATAWYYVFSRHLVPNQRLGAFVGGWICGFAPAMISQSAGHVNFVAQFLLPFIVLAVIRLGRLGRVVRSGLVLGGLVIWQFFINQELLAFTALACGILVAVWAVQNREQVRERWRPFALSLGVAGGLAAVVLAYPLYVEFAGPQRYESLPVSMDAYYADVYSYLRFSSESLAGGPESTATYVDNVTEENSFLGWPLALVTVGLAIALWRHFAARVAIAVGGVFGLVSLGNRIMVMHHDTGIPGPYRLVSLLPALDLSLPSRYALAIPPTIGLLVTLGFERASQATWPRPVTTAASRALGGRLGLPSPRLALGVVAVAALVPILPTPVTTSPAPQVPHFFTSGAWREFVPIGATVVPVPTARFTQTSMAAMRWSSAAGHDFKMAGGYFLGPASETDRAGTYGAQRPTTRLFDGVAETGIVPEVTEAVRAAVAADLMFWRASVVVLAAQEHEEELRSMLVLLLGPGLRADDVWLWDVRSMTGVDEDRD